MTFPTHARRVVKIGGRPQADVSLPARVAAAWRASPGALVVVHGGGDEISALQLALNATPQFVGGRRVTAPADIETLRMALSGAANKRLVARLRAAGLPAVGLSGEDGGVIEATLLDADTYGEVGTPSAVNAALIEQLLSGGWLPVLSPVASCVGDPARALNVNGDDAAAAIAGAIGAEELLLVADVPGVLAGGVPVGTLTPDEARALVASGVAAGGMGAKLQAAIAALEAGVGRVRIGDLAAIANGTHGTTIRIPHDLQTTIHARSVA